MKKSQFQRHKFDGIVKLIIFFGLIAFDVFLQIRRSPMADTVLMAILVLAIGSTKLPLIK